MEESANREYGEELIRIVEAFRERIIVGMSDPEHFLTISDIERLWSELRGNTSLLYSDMLAELLAEVDESRLIHKKKRNTETRE